MTGRPPQSGGPCRFFVSGALSACGNQRSSKSARIEDQRSSKSAKSKPGDDQAGHQGPRRSRPLTPVAGSARRLPRSGRDQHLGLRARPPGPAPARRVFAPEPQLHGRAALPEPQLVAPDPVPRRLLAGRRAGTESPWPAPARPAIPFRGPSAARSGTSPGSTRLPGGARAASAATAVAASIPWLASMPCPNAGGGTRVMPTEHLSRRRPGTRGTVPGRVRGRDGASHQGQSHHRRPVREPAWQRPARQVGPVVGQHVRSDPAATAAAGWLRLRPYRLWPRSWPDSRYRISRIRAPAMEPMIPAVRRW